MIDLFDKNFLKTLRMLNLITRKYFKRERMGVRRTRNRGTSQEFSDYKEYDPGDDLRFLDWNIYGRLDRMFVKLFYSEEALNVYLLVDTSASMRFGNPSKLDYARRVAAAAAYIALARHDRVLAIPFASGISDNILHGNRPGQALAFFRFLQKLEPQAAGDLKKTANEFVLRYKRPGVVFVVSDFLFESGVQEALRLLNFHRYEVNCVQLMDVLDEEPRLTGLCHLIDSEDGSLRAVDVDAPTLALYQDVLQEFYRGLESFCAGNQVGYYRAVTSTPFENLILRLFKSRRSLSAAGALS